MLDLGTYVEEVYSTFPGLAAVGPPWAIAAQAEPLIGERLRQLGTDYVIEGSVAVHRRAVVELGAVLKGPVVVSAGCFVAAHAYLRGGVFLAEGVTVGPGCEVKASFIFGRSTLAHFNFVGDSIVGSHVNLEAGSILVNHFNEREDKEIFVRLGKHLVPTGTQKFGALVGDFTRIGANAVTTPGTILARHSVVGRLQLVDQTQS